MYQQPPHPQQMPPQPGFGRVLLDASFNPMNWFLYFIKPVVVVNGQGRQVEWGQLPIDLPAGQHNIEVHFPYFGKPRGVARATIPVQPGQQQPVHYRAPANMLLSGAMGPTRPATPGMASSLAILGVVTLVLLISFLV
ncbi:hypothetical protein [Allokutzneria oryzae]|uniref:PEGA domain-containing protein n=1 Tax=Allokutzneria oryzae TaxID=1378989 RepID=A0ABV6A4G8_9PSEU